MFVSCRHCLIRNYVCTLLLVLTLVIYKIIIIKRHSSIYAFEIHSFHQNAIKSFLYNYIKKIILNIEGEN